MSDSSSILLIYTGGTIGMVMDPVSGALKPFSLDNLLRTVPELQSINFELDSTSFEEPIDSSDMSFEVWQTLGKIILENYDRFDGFVILHGTDTMAYTASALSFMLSGLNKPVILTGSQLPVGMIRTDGKENLLGALEIAAQKNSNGEPLVPEVCIYFDAQLFRGNRCHKRSTQNFEAFDSPNFPALAEAGVDIKYRPDLILPMEKKSFKVYDKLEKNIQVLTLFPGQPMGLLEKLLDYEELKGIVLRTYGSGNAPSNVGLDKILEKLIQKGVVILNTTQCRHGAVNQKKYESGTRLEQIGVIGGKDITLESALTKMMVSMGNFDKSTFHKNLNKSLRGELTE